MNDRSSPAWHLEDRHQKLILMPIISAHNTESRSAEMRKGEGWAALWMSDSLLLMLEFCISNWLFSQVGLWHLTQSAQTHARAHTHTHTHTMAFKSLGWVRFFMFFKEVSYANHMLHLYNQKYRKKIVKHFVNFFCEIELQFKITVFYFNILSNIIYSYEFSASLLRPSVLNDHSGIIPICWFIINVGNHRAAYIYSIYI